MLRLVEGHIDMIEAEKRALLKAGRKAQDASDLDGTAMIAALTRIHGIGLNDATLLAGEVFYRDFRNRRELGSLGRADVGAVGERRCRSRSRYQQGRAPRMSGST